MSKELFYKCMLLVIFCGWQGASAQIADRTETRICALTNAGELVVENKYGAVVIESWDKDSVEIVTEIKVSNKDLGKAWDLLDRIQSELQVSQDYVEVVSRIQSKSSSGLSRFFRKVNPIETDKTNIDIDYHIKMPPEAQLEIHNQYGDVIINNWRGRLKANVEHGDIRINATARSADVSMKFGKFKTHLLPLGQIEIKNGHVEIRECPDLRINSNGSQIELGTTGILELYSTRDEVDIDMVDNIRGNVKFSDIHIQQFGKEMDLNLHLAGVQVRGIIDRRPKIILEQKSSDIDINISGANFELEALLEEGKLRLPTSTDVVESKILDEKKKERRIQAIYGSRNSGQFKLQGSGGNIILREAELPNTTTPKPSKL